MNNNTFDVKRKACTKCENEFEATTENFCKAKNGLYGLSSVCKPCQKKWRDARRDIKREYDKKYVQENLEHILKRSKEYYHKNFEKIAEREKEKAKTPEMIKRRREYRKTRKERDALLYKKWRKDNSDRISTIKQRRYNRKKKLESNLTHEQWLKIVSDFDNRCAYCGEEKELTREHFIPVTKYGEFTKDNVIPACRSCNSSKNNRDFFEWYPTFEYYSKQREKKILEYLNYNKNKEQQLALL